MMDHWWAQIIVGAIFVGVGIPLIVGLFFGFCWTSCLLWMLVFVEGPRMVIAKWRKAEKEVEHSGPSLELTVGEKREQKDG